MGATARQRAYRKVREAKRVLQTAIAAGHLTPAPYTSARMVEDAVDEILAGQYPCKAHCEVGTGNYGPNLIVAVSLFCTHPLRKGDPSFRPLHVANLVVEAVHG